MGRGGANQAWGVAPPSGGRGRAAQQTAQRAVCGDCAVVGRGAKPAPRAVCRLCDGRSGAETAQAAASSSRPRERSHVGDSEIHVRAARAGRSGITEKKSSHRKPSEGRTTAEGTAAAGQVWVHARCGRGVGGACTVRGRWWVAVAPDACSEQRGVGVPSVVVRRCGGRSVWWAEGWLRVRAVLRGWARTDGKQREYRAADSEEVGRVADDRANVLVAHRLDEELRPTDGRSSYRQARGSRVAPPGQPHRPGAPRRACACSLAARARRRLSERRLLTVVDIGTNPPIPTPNSVRASMKVAKELHTQHRRPKHA
eukprot:6536183-Prymnesium_polylepis.1